MAALVLTKNSEASSVYESMLSILGLQTLQEQNLDDSQQKVVHEISLNGLEGNLKELSV